MPPSDTTQTLQEAARRRTFAIISHPDAGKTTLTEKMLLYAGAVDIAGSVRDRRQARSTTSDWQAIEQRRGISVASTVMRFEYDGVTVNLLDTPGHRDFSEDTYRVLSATDAAVMVIDAARGVEEQTLKLFEVSRTRGIPLLTFVNKCDRPGPGPLAILDDIEAKIGVHPTPVTWPVGDGAEFAGVVDRRSDELVVFRRREHGAAEAGEERLGISHLAELGTAGDRAHEELDLLRAVGSDHDSELFEAQETTPVFFGSALWNFGIRHLLDAILELAPPPAARTDVAGGTRALDDDFSGFVFKIQANMDRQHRDHVAFVRVCSGRFERGMPVVHEPSGRTISTKYAQSMFGQERESLQQAWPGDVIGLVNAGDVRVGDTLYRGEHVRFPPIPTFAPELFMTAHNSDTSKRKQFARGLEQLDREGVVQVLRHPERGDREPVLAAVGALQFDVARERLEGEFGAPVLLEPSRYTIARRTDPESAGTLRDVRYVDVLERPDGNLLALFDSSYVLNKTLDEHPELTLEHIVVS
ncbi:MAG: peptide chain release factor 3 [Actinobacteria bacterium ATB1]|nr:peptide chain release factor 3 [Actinobacteria bacterium ATB1]